MYVGSGFHCLLFCPFLNLTAITAVDNKYAGIETTPHINHGKEAT
jgi:hypothetical protein